MPEGDALRRIQQNIDQTMRGVIADSRRGIPTSASMIPNSQREDETPRATSAGSVPVTSPPGIDIIDRMVDAQDRTDRIAAIRQASENAWIESHFERGGPRIESDYEPFDDTHMKK